ncbi:chaplin family protein [Actinoallomurus sp. NPDC050550]|uniref:chaplin family protein n=1 Tax=Actinoallomurus sp. NPDC050550 TaxID=3154937 RepID=UPI0033C6BD88
MRKWTVRAARAVLVGAAFAAVGTGIANADTTSGDHSIAGGTQIPVSVPNLLAGSAINVLSPHSNVSTGSTQRFRYSYHHRSSSITATSLGGSSIGSDNQVAAPVTAPIIICGNAVSAGGLGTATCKGHSSISSGASSSQASSACNASCAQAPSACNASCAQAPSACNAACAPAAEAPAAPVCSQACAPAAPAKPEAPVCSQACQQPAGAPAACQETCAQHSTQSTDMARDQLLSNNQATVPVTAPIVVCGNSAAIRGIAASACDGDASFTRNVS